jgi:hypothetical protein
MHILLLLKKILFIAKPPPTEVTILENLCGAIKKGTATSCPFEVRQDLPKTRKQRPRRGTDFHAFFGFKFDGSERNAKKVQCKFLFNCLLQRAKRPCF